MKKTVLKTKMTFHEARAAAFAEFGPKLTAGDIAHFAKMYGDLADLLHGLVFEKVVSVTFTNGESCTMTWKVPTRGDVKREFQHALNVERQSAIMEQWAREDCDQRYQVDSAIWYECWNKQAIA